MQQPRASAPGLKGAVSHRLSRLARPARVLVADAGAQRVGRGGTAEVWSVADRRRGRIALKRLCTHVAQYPGSAAWLEREHDTIASLRHPQIVKTYGMAEFRGAPALALEYLGGGDLVALIGAPVRSWIAAAADVVAALAHVHARGYVYRDLKARNVLFDGDDRARLVDFASVQALGASVHGGTTAAYRPAEAARAATVREDELALAALVYELLAGRLPFGPDGARDGAARLAPLVLPAREPAAVRALCELAVDTLRSGLRGTIGSLSEARAVIDTVAGDPTFASRRA